MQKWQHCTLIGNKVRFLGAASVFENKSDAYMTERSAWSKLEDEGWLLVSVVVDGDGNLVHYLRRPASPEE